ncbi:hypothetical protein [Nocardioides pelophilus]|uniref:hypothetical protein n=1 Tax=Nocardioides pelophilus TaxID=2172019 RepID=UPI0015FEBCBD|nr:hypothetical protein [Nocardioides pelophilus]
MPPFGQLRYDRSVSEEFLGHFLPDGFASSLLQYARARYPIDFQFRKDPKTGAQWATLYLGMTAVLNVEDKRDKGVRLTAHPKYANSLYHWADDWAQTNSPETWRSRWPAVENYLERIIPAVMTDGRLTATEGLVQAAVSVYIGDSTRVMLDREVTPYFLDTATKNAILTSYSNPLAEAIEASNPVPGKPRTPFGARCDVLALRKDGCLVAIEVKPGSVASLAWVPAQATMYARVLQHWVDNDPGWAEIITASYEQRHRLGLVPEGFKLPKLQPRVVPAVAFQRIASAEYIDRMFKVHKALQTSTAGHPDIQFFEVSLSGRLDERHP